MSYILGTGYYSNGRNGLDWFAKVWLENTFLFADPLPERIVVVSVGGSHPPYPAMGLDGITPINVLDLTGNAGHVHQLLGISKPHKPYHYCGVTATFATLASLAYANECDFVYKEQDCLAFGLWVQQMYDELGGHSMAFGRCRIMGSAQSLFVIRHQFLPSFISYLFRSGSERDHMNLPEHKFSRLLIEMPDQVKYLSFGYDRDRPLNMTDMVWYAQKFTPD